jgi:hypothetical protein
MSWDAVIWIATLLVVSTGLGLLWKASTGRARSGRARSAPTIPLDLADVPAGSQATLLQFSTAMCSACPPTRRLLGSIAAQTHGVQHVEINLTDRPELATRFAIFQTPTTLVVDARASSVRGSVGRRVPRWCTPFFGHSSARPRQQRSPRRGSATHDRHRSIHLA